MEVDFEKLGVYDLRNYARNLGIISPTTLKRDVLLKKIQDVLNGIEKPEKKKNNKGRPPKHKNNDMYLLDLVVPDNLFKTNNIDDRYKQYTTSASIFPTFKDILCENNTKSNTDNLIFTGYFKRITDGFGLVLFNGFVSQYIKENTIVLNSLIAKYGIKDGDYVLGACKYVAEKNVMLATSIEKINDVEVNNINKLTKNEVINYPNKIIEMSSSNLIDLKVIEKVCPIAKGARVAINYNSNDIHNFCIELLNVLSKNNNMRTLLVSIDDTPEDIYDIFEKCEKIELCQYKVNITRQQYFEKLDLMTKNYYRRFLNGENVVIIVYNAKNLIQNMKDMQILSGRNVEEANILAKNNFLDTMMLAHNGNNGSLTTIAFSSNFDDIKSFANCNIQFMNHCYAGTDIDIDLKNSYTKNMDKIVDKKSLKKLEDFKSVFNDQNVVEKLDKLF